MKTMIQVKSRFQSFEEYLSYEVEVVSPKKLQRNRDYIAKRSQYRGCGIPEYWIVDPNTQTILVLKLKDNNYIEVGNFSGQNRLISPQLEKLNLTAARIFDLADEEI